MSVDVLLPVAGRADALAVTLHGLAGQTCAEFRLLLSDQSPGAPAYDEPAVQAGIRLLRARGVTVELGRHLPRRGIAEHRAHLLSLAAAERVLCLDSDVWLEPGALARLVDALDTLGCGFVGAPFVGLSHVADVRPHEQVAFEPWDGPVVPERVRKGTPAWERWRLHNAANPVHLADRFVGEDGWLAYKVAWVAGCVLFDRAALVSCGGFDFWRDLPTAHRGEDVVVQLRVMERYGGAGVLPSGAYHLELPTSLPQRGADAYTLVLEDEAAS